MGDKFKNAANVVFGLAVFIGLLAVPLIFIKGAVWASEHILPSLIGVGWLVLAVVLVILLPLSVFSRLRVFTGIGIFISSYIFGLICWLAGFVVTYVLWGLWAIIVGLIFFGGGVVPIGIIASLFKGEWQVLSVLVGLVVLTFGFRFLGLYIMERAR